MSGDRDPAMTEADRAFVQAVAKADKPAMEKLLDADFTWTDFDGQIRTKEQVLRDPSKSAIANENAAKLKQYTYGDLGDVQSNLGKAHLRRERGRIARTRVSL
jgi:hypothetical protein